MNKIYLIGNICNDLELRALATGTSVCSFNLAVRRTGAEEKTDFIPVTVFGKQADNLTNYQQKGSKIAVAGVIRVDTWENEQKEKRSKTYVVANEIEYVGTKLKEEHTAEDYTKQVTPTKDVFAEFGAEFANIPDDALPF